MNLNDVFGALQHRLESAVVGQEALVNRLLIALLVDGHLLVEGAPGLAKTRAIKSLADQLEADFRRVQFTPDLLPADLTGTEVYRPSDGTFAFQQGPLFNNLILADEINRAPAKVQSALLEAMAEQQITVGHHTYNLPGLFMVMATQNPIEQEGTYPLPEAQLDRFLMQVNIDYPPASKEAEILRLVRREIRNSTNEGSSVGTMNTAMVGDATVDISMEQQAAPTVSATDIHFARAAVLEVEVAENVEDYMVRLITATRVSTSRAEATSADSAFTKYIAFGASPRGTLALDSCARAHAWLNGRAHVSPADVQAVVHDVLRHRLVLSFEAEANGITSDHVIDELVRNVAVP